MGTMMCRASTPRSPRRWQGVLMAQHGREALWHMAREGEGAQPSLHPALVAALNAAVRYFYEESEESESLSEEEEEEEEEEESVVPAINNPPKAPPTAAQMAEEEGGRGGLGHRALPV
eukprot:COSAG01_NODE_435_length_17065_cov_46.870977_9_plen_118_part_00